MARQAGQTSAATDPVVKVEAMFPYGWRVRVVALGGAGVDQWHRRAKTWAELREAMNVAARFRKTMMEKWGRAGR